MKADNIGASALRNARVTLTQLNDFKPLDTVEYLDIAKFINHIRDEHNYAVGTISLRKAYIKKYFKYHDRDDIVKKLEIKREQRQLNPADILNVEDMNFLIEKIDSVMYRAIVTFLFESGARINEALAVKLDEDIKEINVGFDLTLFGDKTRAHNYAYREMILIESASYIREWLLVRNSDSPYLFPIRDRSVGEWLSNFRENINFKKPLNPHAFRHGCATRLVRKGMQESLIRKQMGWSPNSNMLAVYIHLADTDLKTYQLMQSGEMTEETPMVELVQPVETTKETFNRQNEYLMKQMQEMASTMVNMRGEIDRLKLEQHEIEPYENPPTPPSNVSEDELEDAIKNFDPVEAEKRYVEDKAKASVSEPTQQV